MKGMTNWGTENEYECGKKKKKYPEVTGTAEQFLWGKKT